MRKALIGILIATTAASPLAAQDNGWHGRGDGEHHQRAERQQQPQQRAPRQEQSRAPTERQGGWQARQQVQVQAAPQQVQVQQQAQTRGYRQGGAWQGQQTAQSYRGQSYRGQSYGGNWQGQSDPRRDAYRQQIEASREANRQVRQTMPESYQRQAIRNEQRYEGQVRAEQYRRQGYQTQRSYNGYRSERRVDWNRSWRNDRRYDWQRYRYSNRSLFRSPYYAPYGYGYGYNRLSIGLILDPIFFGQNYWIGDPWQYRLPAAPYGTQWVRYYNDVLLVDVYTGEVVDVIYDFFW
jgi:Ni/Co efflux regulator RcnB